MADLAVYFSLFLTAFVAATLLPMQSEAVLVGLLLMETYSVWTLIAVASAGNILGSAINWVLGRSLERFRDHKWFPAKEETLERAQRWYSRYGKWTLLCSWMPIVGDPLTVVAGVMREPFLTFILFVAIAKITRYVVVAAAAVTLFA